MPLPVIRVAQMREWEKATWASGQTEAEVIRLVGKEIARHALLLTRPQDRLLVLAGKGNNGADARAAHPHLPDRRVDSLDVKDPDADLSRLDALLSLRPALIIDGLFGIGLNRPLDAPWIRLLSRVNQADRAILAVDVPSGLDADTGTAQGEAIKATVTLTVGAPKIGMLSQSAWPYVGRIEVASPVGLIPCPLTSEITWSTPDCFADFPPRRASATHKGSYGHLGILAGSLGYHGAAVLATHAATRAQPGLVTLHTMENVYLAVASQLQAPMVAPWTPQTDLLQPYSALLIGPGLASRDVPDSLKDRVRAIWKNSQTPVIVDASALDWLVAEPYPNNAIRVLTPHPGEAARLLQIKADQVQADRFEALRELSRRFHNAWIVLKGHQTLIGRSSGEISVNSSGNPHLAQGGSGDVLGGFIAGLLAQPLMQPDPFAVLRYAVWQHGAVADQLQASRKNWGIEELVEAIGQTEAPSTREETSNTKHQAPEKLQTSNAKPQ